MNSEPNAPSKANCAAVARRHGPALLAVAAAFWVCRYWSISDYGLYSDDWFRAARALNFEWEYMWKMFGRLFANFGAGQGRPLHGILIYFFTYLGGLTGSLTGAYLVGYLIQLGNLTLFYALLCRVSRNRTLAVCGALAYALYPVDTTQVFLTHSLGAHPSLSFLLIALHLYVTPRLRPLSYVVASGSLLCYETAFPVFLAAPLLVRGHHLPRRFFVHGLILAMLVGGMGLVRWSKGERRVQELTTQDMVMKPLRLVTLGPAYNLRFFAQRPVESLVATRGGALLIPLLSIPAFALLLLWARKDQYGEQTVQPSPNVKATTGGEDQGPPGGLGVARLLLTGFLMLALSYPLMLTVSPHLASGRASRVHLSGVVGAAILVGILLAILIHVAGGQWLRLVAVVLVAAFFAGAIQFGFQVQKDYVVAWERQQWFWREMIRLCPDLENGILILYEHEKLPTSTEVHEWSNSYIGVLGLLHQLPYKWKLTPRLYSLYPDWRERMAESGDIMSGVNTRGMSRGQLEPYREAEVILIEVRDGALYRAESPVTVGELSLPIRATGPATTAEYGRRPLYKYVIGAPTATAR